jgi:glutamate-5-semialdehyde dehydrogenase
MPESKIEHEVTSLAQEALKASRVLATTGTEQKNDVLRHLANLLEENTDAIIEANQQDLQLGESAGLSRAMLDRLLLTPARIHAMADGVRQIVALPDPVGRTLEERTHQKGFHIYKKSVPIGVIGIIYESRPNVTIDCAALCIKAGNAVILRGGKEAAHSNAILASLVAEALKRTGLPEAAASLIPTQDRYALHVLLKLDDYVHCIIPRGGESLIRFVAENARMPVIKHYKGVCNMFVDKDAEKAMAEHLVINAKCQRPGVCNAIENLILHRSNANVMLPALAKELIKHKVELRVDVESAAILEKFGGVPFKIATEEDYYEEYLDLILAVKIVADVNEAIQFVNTYGSLHSEAIVTSNKDTATAFLQGVDAAVVYWNVSTRFTDGYEFGLGAEIGISTDKLHARGPMGLNELTTYKYQVIGHGETR